MAKANIDWWPEGRKIRGRSEIKWGREVIRVTKWKNITHKEELLRKATDRQ